MLSEKPWKPDAVLLYLFSLSVSFSAGVLLLIWLTSPSSPFAFDRKILAAAVATLTFHGMALALAHFFLQAHDMSWSTGFGFGSPRLGKTLLLAVTVGIVVLPVALSLAWASGIAMTKFHLDPVVQDTVQTLQSAESTEVKVFLGILAVFVAPFAEELVFRGVLYPAIKQQGFPRLALWGTSLLFATIHFNAMTFLSLTLLAVILTLLYETTNNLLAPIVTHSLFNLANIVWLVIHPAAR